MKDDWIVFLLGGNRFATWGEYRFDRLIFSVYVLLILAFFIGLFCFYGSDRAYHLYYNCNIKDGFCESPFFNNHPVCETVWPGACDQESVPAGFSFGKPVPFVVKNWGFFVFIGLISCFILNHFFHNSGKRPEIQVED